MQVRLVIEPRAVDTEKFLFSRVIDVLQLPRAGESVLLDRKEDMLEVTVTKVSTVVLSTNGSYAYTSVRAQLVHVDVPIDNARQVEMMAERVAEYGFSQHKPEQVFTY